jgi:hypothetical protein
MKRYMRLVEHYRENIPTEGEYHHIIPKCLGGTNEKQNIVLLPYKAHFICHLILTKIYPENRKLKHALSMMCVVNKLQNRVFSSSQYETARKNRSDALKGIPRDESVKQKLRKPKADTSNYRKSKSLSHRMNIGKAHKGKKHDWQYKIFESSGYKEHQKKRTENMLKTKNYHRQNFIQMNVSRKQYYTLYPEIAQPTMKRYLRGL